MNSNRYSLISMLIFFISFFLNCSNSHDKTVIEYIEHIKNSRYAKAYELLSAEDKKIISKTEYFKDNDSDNLSKIIQKNIKYSIIESIISKSGNNASVKVEISEPDLYRIFLKIPQLTNKNLSSSELKKLINTNKHLIDGNSNFRTVVYKLIKENGSWFIFADYEKINMIKKMQNYAAEFYNKGNYSEALNAYKAVYEYKQDNITIDKIKLLTEKINYINDFIKIKYKFSEGNIQAEIINTGNIMISSYKLEIKLISAGGEIFVFSENVQKDGDNKFGHNESVKKTVNIMNKNMQPDKVICRISAFEY